MQIGKGDFQSPPLEEKIDLVLKGLSGLSGLITQSEKARVQSVLDALVTVEQVQINVLKVDGSSVVMDISSAATVDTIKKSIIVSEGIAVYQQQLFLSGPQCSSEGKYEEDSNSLHNDTQIASLAFAFSPLKDTSSAITDKTSSTNTLELLLMLASVLPVMGGISLWLDSADGNSVIVDSNQRVVTLLVKSNSGSDAIQEHFKVFRMLPMIVCQT
jgi:hypothetical protein